MHQTLLWRRKWQPTPVFLPSESYGQKSLVGCHLWGCTESDTTDVIWQQQQTLLWTHGQWLLCLSRTCYSRTWAKSLYRVRLCNPKDWSPQAPLSTGFSRQEYCSGFPCPPPGNPPDPGIKPVLICLLHWQAGSWPLAPLAPIIIDILP